MLEGINQISQTYCPMISCVCKIIVVICLIYIAKSLCKMSKQCQAQKASFTLVSASTPTIQPVIQPSTPTMGTIIEPTVAGSGVSQTEMYSRTRYDQANNNELIRGQQKSIVDTYRRR